MKAYRFIALRYKKKPKPATADEPEQYQLFDTPEYAYRVFVTNRKRAIDLLVWFYDQRAGRRMNCNHSQLTMLAYNLNCWLMLFNREEEGQVATFQHTPGDGAFAVPVSRREDLASRGQSRCQLQRSLRRATNLSAVDGPTADDHERRAAVPSCAGMALLE